MLTDTVPNLGLTPFAAKSLAHATTLFLAACLSVMPGGMSVLCTSVSMLTATCTLPDCAAFLIAMYPKSSGADCLLCDSRARRMIVVASRSLIADLPPPFCVLPA